MDVDGFFAGRPGSRAVFDALTRAVASLGDADVRVTKSQVAFARGRVFARAWVPEQYLGDGRGAPLVLTLGFRDRDPSPRWKEIVEPAPGRFTHHLELWSADDVDDEVIAWLRRARSDVE